VLFTGTHQHTIDTKGRLSIPADFRQALMRGNKQPPFLALDDACLRLYRHNDFKKQAEPLIARSQFDPNRKNFSRRLFFNTTPAAIDSQGRILVPQFLRQAAHLERDVVLGGAGLTIEIWNPERLAVLMNETQENLPTISMEMADKLGI
jgi:MraZ protein